MKTIEILESIKTGIKDMFDNDPLIMRAVNILINEYKIRADQSNPSPISQEEIEKLADKEYPIDGFFSGSPQYDKDIKVKRLAFIHGLTFNKYAELNIAKDLKVGDKIDVGGFITTLEEIKYDPFAKIDLYWFYNERGEYKYNLKEFIQRVDLNVEVDVAKLERQLEKALYDSLHVISAFDSIERIVKKDISAEQMKQELLSKFAEKGTIIREVESELNAGKDNSIEFANWLGKNQWGRNSFETWKRDVALNEEAVTTEFLYNKFRKERGYLSNH